MIDPITGQPHPAHTTNPVPFIAVGADLRGRKLRHGGRLADGAPTILEYMKLPQPPEMDAGSLFERAGGGASDGGRSIWRGRGRTRRRSRGRAPRTTTAPPHSAPPTAPLGPR